MENNVITYDEFMEGLNRETKFDKFKRKAKAKAKKVGEFCKDNWLAILIGTSVTLAVVDQGVKTFRDIKPAKSEAEKERDRIDHTYYDPSTGMHWDLRRKATNEDRIAIEDRKGKDSMSEILSDLKLI